MRSSDKSREIRIAVDTGGTFTDCVWVDGGRVQMLKVFSTPDDPSRAIVEAVTKIMERVRPGSSRGLVLLHGTTVGTNTLLQRKGARVAFVTTKGFEDTIEIGRQARPKLYYFFFDRVEPLIPQGLRFGVEERTTADGEVLKPVQNVGALLKAVEARQPEAVAVSLLFSFANPKNEQLVVENLKQLGVPISVSHELLPEFREYERASTVVVNAYLQPVMQKYLQSLSQKLNGNRSGAKATRVFVMQSSGGITSLETASREPVRTVLSGPAGGVIGAAAMARVSGFDRIIGFDMGGTSTDVCLVDGEARATNEAEVAGIPVRVPTLDIHTVGAGGGSIARFDAAGALRVGPESAGADPGPICYGRGTRPTVSDANLLLGRLRADAFLGGSFTLDVERTRRLVTEYLKKNHPKMTLQQFAEGVIRVVNSTMEKAIRVVSIERGYDPREFALVAFGGAGGLHACELARALSIPTVIVPAMPGTLSAYGILVSDVVKDYSRTVLLRSKDVLPEKLLDTAFRGLESAARTEFKAEGWKGALELMRTVDLRYRGQGFELNVKHGPQVMERFHAEHKRRFGYSSPEREVEIVTVRVRARMRSEGRSRARVTPDEPRHEHREAINRSQLQPLPIYRGPAVITEYSATTVVPAGCTFKLDKAGNLVIRVPDNQRESTQIEKKKGARRRPGSAS